MKMLAKTEGMVGVDFDGRRYDMGNKLGILKAWVEQGILRKDFGDEFKEFLKETVRNLD